MAPRILIRRKDSTPVGPYRVDHVRLALIEEGKPAREFDRVCFERGDAVAVLVHRVDTDEVILTRQFRYPAFANAREGCDGFLLEIPAGLLEAGESPEATGRREVEEEVGYTLDRLERIGNFFVSPGASSERIDLFYAAVHGGPTGKGGGLVEENEEIEIVSLATAKFLACIALHEIRDAKTLIAGLWLASRRR